MKKLGLWLLVPLMFFTTPVQAKLSTGSVHLDLLKSNEDFNYPDFYKIKESSTQETPQDINLLTLDHHLEKFPLPEVPYKRDTHFGGWLRDRSNGSCLNTRGKVLVRDSARDVTYKPGSSPDKPQQCTVDGGEWNDPYTAHVFTSAQDIQIDHLVALKNAYMTGAYEWDFKKRCLYANYLGNNFHLLSVNGRENQLKSDHTPEGYIPPNGSYVCQFVKQWLNVKLIWSLRITPKEATAIDQIVSEHQCKPQIFAVSHDELARQREFMTTHANLCGSSAVVLEAF